MRLGVGLIGRKLGMTQMFREDGRPVAVTVLEAGPCSVVRVKSVEGDGYPAVQLGFGERPEKRVAKPVLGQFKKAQVSPKQVVREFRLPRLAAAPGKPAASGEKPAAEMLAPGATVTVELFKPGDRVDVSGVSIGKGFQGGMARWNWRGGPATHGSMSHRAPGSIGSSSEPSRVYKGHHLPGRMGGERTTIQNLEVIQVDLENHLLLVRGAVPGSDRSVVTIVKSRRQKKAAAAPASKKGKGEAKEGKAEKKEAKPEKKDAKAEKKGSQAEKKEEKKG
ncbi:MAG: 50S ribosomal protein L3 [Candidatus Omnitrophica bacterium CG11_big_fil_rev_8_21_14_0_20_64_10]|nr:MAG: 50S ribosomal protein L3 [Candidatus Omnitrophica bacterium CG11_big_fil_rev_8_21_14_0_20_64_10]